MEITGTEIIGVMVAGAIVVATAVFFYLRVVKGRSADLTKREDGKVIK